ncbi:MAG: hypothetical protein VX737_03310 [Pseudomonadota bacterium]|nr:hypothetical protein [Pseudomonadota bacterium]
MSERDQAYGWDKLSKESLRFNALVFFGSTLSPRDLECYFWRASDFKFWFICWSGNYELMSWLFTKKDDGKTNFIELQL